MSWWRRCGPTRTSCSKPFAPERALGWHEHDHRLFAGTDRFFRPGYRGHLVAEWIPALDGVEEKLRDGARVADIGCGLGSSTHAHRRGASPPRR